ncbi:MAG: hypothetical protein QOI59_5863 [Gammaproteobacteria bacterium]|nr:hypothetical protein [Gammaproteobacteria bacterium]
MILDEWSNVWIRSIQTIAEKLQAMVGLGEANSRMKDFYDVWVCASHLDFEREKLLKAVEATFKNRETVIPTDDFEVLTEGFVEQHLMQWNAFVKKIEEGTLVNRFDEAVEDLRNFAIPMFRCIALTEKIGKQWRAGKGWLAETCGRTTDISQARSCRFLIFTARGDTTLASPNSSADDSRPAGPFSRQIRAKGCDRMRRSETIDWCPRSESNRHAFKGGGF